MEMMEERSFYLVDEFVEQMKWRHPYITPTQFAVIRSNLLHFRLEKRM
jgi:hypothetical protein